MSVLMAIDAMDKTEPSKRHIGVIDDGKENYLNNRIEKYCSTPIVFQNDMPKTSKDPNYHGFGMKSMKNIAENITGK